MAPERGPRRREGNDLGRDGITGMVSRDRAVRAREVSSPDADQRRSARDAVAALIARATGRR